MRLETIICLSIIVIVGLVVFYYYMRIISYGYWFCELSYDFFEIVRTLESIKKIEKNSGGPHAIVGKYIRILYEPGNYNSIYFELEYIIMKISEYYQVIEDKEEFFRFEDWDKIQNTKRDLREKINYIRNQEWLHGYRKI